MSGVEIIKHHIQPMENQNQSRKWGFNHCSSTEMLGGEKIGDTMSENEKYHLLWSSMLESGN